MAIVNLDKIKAWNVYSSETALSVTRNKIAITYEQQMLISHYIHCTNDFDAMTDMLSAIEIVNI